MVRIKVDNLAEAWHELCASVRDHPYVVPNDKGKFNFRGDYYIHLYDFFVETKRHDCPNLYLEDMGYTSHGSKATHLTGRYLDVETANRWIDYIVECVAATPYVRGEIPIRTKEHYTKRPMAGGCITDMFYRQAPKPTLIIISRSMEVPTKAMGDIFFISSIARLICERVGLQNLRIKWYLASVWTRTRTANYYLIYNWPKKVKWASPHFQEHVDKGFQKYYLSDEHEFTYHANIRAKTLFIKKRSGTLKRVTDVEAFYKKVKEYLDGKN